MTRLPILLAIAVLVGGCATASPSAPGSSAVIGPSVATSPSPSPTEAAHDSPLGQALLFAPPNFIGMEFTDWTQLKAEKGFPDLTSAASLADREAFVATLRSRGLATPAEYLPGLAYSVLSATLRDQWGFDALDLTWEARIAGTTESRVLVQVLRLRDGFDVATLRPRFQERGYAEERYGAASIWTHAVSPDPWSVVDGRLGMANVAVLEGAHSLVVGSIDAQLGAVGLKPVLDAFADPALATAMRSRHEPTALALDRPLSAVLMDGQELCTRIDPANNRFPSDVLAEIAAAGPLHRYVAFGIGYSRAHDPIGRYVFAYATPADAAADLAGRESLARTGTRVGGQEGGTYADLFAVHAARVAGQLMVLDVAPTDDLPQRIFDLIFRRDLTFAVCTA